MLPAYDVRDLMQGGTQVRMVLDGTVYFLRVTRAGKLILTK
ncbi:MAG: hemin uptake protein HemP [Pseudomonadota bacterium]